MFFFEKSNLARLMEVSEICQVSDIQRVGRMFWLMVPEMRCVI